MERLRQELAQHEDHIITSSEHMAQQFRQHAVQALAEGPEVLRDGLNCSQQLSHSLLDEQSSSRLALAKPPPCYQPVSISSVDLTPLTEDLLMNSRCCSDAQTISDSAFPTDTIGEHEVPDVSNEIIEAPLSDDEDDVLIRKYPELTNDSTTFSTPPRVRRALASHSATPGNRAPVQIQSGGRTIGVTELGATDDTSRGSDSLRHAASDNVVKPLRRHAWSDSETEQSTRSIKDIERRSVNTERARSPLAVTRSPLAELPSPASRLPTAPSSEKIEKFELNEVKNRAKSRAEYSDSSLNSKDYPNLQNSFITLQNTIMQDIAALRRELLDKQDGTEKLRSEFADFKRSYYEKSAQGVQTSPKMGGRETFNKHTKAPSYASPAPASPAPKTPTPTTPVRPATPARTTPVRPTTPVRRPTTPVRRPITPVRRPTTPVRPTPARRPPTPPTPATPDEVTSFSDLDSETDRQIATLHALQRSLREQSNEMFLQDLEQHRRSKSRTRESTLVQSEVQSEAHSEVQSESRDAEGTREVFMDILRQKAQQDEENVKQKRREEKEEIEKLRKESNKENERSVRHATVQSFTPSPAAHTPATHTPAVHTPAAHTPARTTPARARLSSDSTLSSSDTIEEEEQGPDLNALWNEFMKYVVQNRALKPRMKQKKKRQDKKSKPTSDPAIPLSNPTPPATGSATEPATPAAETTAPRPAPTAFDISPPDLKTTKFFTGLRDESCLSREERIDRLKQEIEDERRQRQQQRDERLQQQHEQQQEQEQQERADVEHAQSEEKEVEEEEVPVRDTDVECAPPQQRPKALAFDVSFDLLSECSTDVERAPGFPNIVFKHGRLQDAFQRRMHSFMEKSTRRAVHVQLRKEARQRYSNSTPPQRPRATVDPDHFTRFDIPPPRVRLISAREARSHSRKIYQKLPEVTTKVHNNKVERQRETYRLRAKLFNKKVQGHVLGRRPFHALQVY